MKQIDIKKPKYIIPALMLPFILGVGWVVMDMFKEKPKNADEITLAETTDINMDIPEANLEKKEVKSKLGALREAFHKSTDFSSIQSIEKEEAVNEVEDFGSLYSDEEMAKIDSLNKATRLIEKEMKNRENRYRNGEQEPDKGGGREAPARSKMQEEMELFKMQMAYLDSLQNPKRVQGVKVKEEEPKEKAIEVLKASNPADKYFNTLGKNKKSGLITAILDENVKVTQGSRVRIRLLDDIMINEAILTKGTYLYGNVTGFKAQRVNINVNSIMIDGQQMKVDLAVYDNDGQEGFFVPSSAFRDLTKDVGGQLGSQSIQIQNQTEGLEQFAFNALQDAYRSTTQAISKNIKKNKAKLKYNTQVYLINNKEKEK